MQESLYVVRALRADVIVERHGLLGLVQRYLGEWRAGPTEKVDQFVARDRVNPGCERVGRIVGMSLDINGQHRFLNQIFGLRGAPPNACELAFVVYA